MNLYSTVIEYISRAFQKHEKDNKTPIINNIWMLLIRWVRSMKCWARRENIGLKPEVKEQNFFERNGTWPKSEIMSRTD